jgi:hypothetical protein
MDEHEVEPMAWIREIRDRLHEETKDLSRGEYIAYIRQHAVQLRAEIAQQEHPPRLPRPVPKGGREPRSP